MTNKRYSPTLWHFVDRDFYKNDLATKSTVYHKRGKVVLLIGMHKHCYLCLIGGLLKHTAFEALVFATSLNILNILLPKNETTHAVQ